MKNYEIRLSGSGGQGLILAGIILARAAVIDKRKVTQTQSYGPESRGGSSRADVIISDQDLLAGVGDSIHAGISSSDAIGSRTRNVVRPGSDSKSIRPPWPATSFATNASPRPAP